MNWLTKGPTIMLTIRPMTRYGAGALAAAAVCALAAPLAAPAAVAAETGFASIHAWRKERGKTCMVEHFHSGVGQGATKQAARRAAIASWRDFTAWEYGSAWADFRAAGSRGVRYDRTATGWEAHVEGRPCRRR